MAKTNIVLPLENKIHILKPPCNVLFMYGQKDIDNIKEGNDQNYVIDKLTCEIIENKPLGPGM